MVYSNYTNPTATPQTQPIFRRESEMEQSRSGGFGFKTSLAQKLRRFLLTGTINGSYYAKELELTKELFDLLKEAANTDPELLASEVTYCSKHGINNHTPILGLVFLSMGNLHAKQLFKDIFNDVVRTGSHFHEWANYTNSQRGWGQCVKTAGKNWLASKSVKDLTYQMLKYQQRYDFSFRDELRLLKPVTQEVNRNALYSYVVGKPTEVPATDSKDANLISWFEYLKANPTHGELAVRSGNLPTECVTGIAEMNQSVWQALFEQMPIEATLRNLGSLTQLGVLTVSNVDNLNRLAERLRNPVALAKLHPVNILKAMKVYNRDITGKSSKTWTPVPRVRDLLEEAFQNSFETLAPTGKVFFHAVDVSGSMSYNSTEFGPTCCEIAAAMCLATIKAEDNYFVGGFAKQFVDLGITKQDSFRDAQRKAHNNNFGATDASVAYQYAIDHKIKADVFVFWTDGESWAGCNHASQVLKRYRDQINPNAKAVYVTLGTNRITLADPNDPRSYDMASFDSSVPAIIQAIALDQL